MFVVREYQIWLRWSLRWLTFPQPRDNRSKQQILHHADSDWNSSLPDLRHSTNLICFQINHKRNFIFCYFYFTTDPFIDFQS